MAFDSFLLTLARLKASRGPGKKRETELLPWEKQGKLARSKVLTLVSLSLLGELGKVNRVLTRFRHCDVYGLDRKSSGGQTRIGDESVGQVIRRGHIGGLQVATVLESTWPRSTATKEAGRGSTERRVPRCHRSISETELDRRGGPVAEFGATGLGSAWTDQSRGRVTVRAAAG